MYDPPHINGALLQTLLVSREMVDVLGYEQSLMCRSRLSNGFCRERKKDVPEPRPKSLTLCVNMAALNTGNYENTSKQKNAAKAHKTWKKKKRNKTQRK